MILKSLLFFVAAILTVCNAGLLHLRIWANPITIANSNQFRIDSNELRLEESAGGDWRFSFENENESSAKITISPTNVPEGYTARPITFDVLYSWSDKVIPAAIVNDNGELPAARAFWKTVHAVPIDPIQLVWVNQRARRIFLSRYQEIESSNSPQPPQKVDMVIAYYLLETIYALVTQFGMTIDSDTSLAMNWVNDVIHDQRKSYLLFDKKYVDERRINWVIQQLQLRDSIFYNQVVSQIQSDIESKRPERIDHSCKKVRSLANLFDRLPENSRSHFDGNFENSVKIAGLDGYCETRLRLIRGPSGLDVRKRTSDSERVAMRARRILTSASASPRSSRAQMTAVSHLLELESTLRVSQNLPTSMLH